MRAVLPAPLIPSQHASLEPRRQRQLALRASRARKALHRPEPGTEGVARTGSAAPPTAEKKADSALGRPSAALQDVTQPGEVA